MKQFSFILVILLINCVTFSIGYNFKQVKAIPLYDYQVKVTFDTAYIYSSGNYIGATGYLHMGGIDSVILRDNQ